jgi:hypothetical protein
MVACAYCEFQKMKGYIMQKLFFIVVISVMISACGHDFKPPTQDTTPEPGPDYFSATD